MDAAFALLLPLVGGYLYIRGCIYIKYVAAREDGHRLYFRVAYYGVLLFLASLVLLSSVFAVVHELPWFQTIQRFLESALGPLLKDPRQSTAQLGFLLICLSTIPIGRWSPLLINKLLKKSNEQALWDAAAENELEELLLEALTMARSISITLSSNKVYVGFVLSTIEPRTERRVIAMLPTMSGFRTDEGKVTFTTFYDAQIYSARDEADNGEFKLILPIDKMLSISFFDAEIYNQFSSVAAGESTAVSADDAPTVMRDADGRAVNKSPGDLVA